MEIRSPVRICNISVIPSRNPRFHRKEIDLGEGRSIRDLFIIFIKGVLRCTARQSTFVFQPFIVSAPTYLCMVHRPIC